MANGPEGQLTWAAHVSLAPTWFDPAETPGMITPFLLLYALHDAMVKPMPGNAAEPCLAEAWKMAPDGLSYQFTLRQGLKFHNGAPVTAEDVKFSFERYRGTSAALMKERVASSRRRTSAPCASCSRSRGPTSSLSTPRPAAPAGSCRRSTSRKSARKASRRRRSAPALQVRLLHAGRRAGVRGVRGLLAQDAGGEAAGLQGDPRGVDAARGAEAREVDIAYSIRGDWPRSCRRRRA
jgi:hypothetical protein